MSGKSGKFVAYYRVSTEGQERSGLGLDAQRRKVEEYLGSNGWELVAEFEETGSGTDSDRPELEKALTACRIHGAALIVAKLDRLTRDAGLLFRLRDEDVEIRFANMPEAEAEGLTVGILAQVAEREARMISERTKAALAELKAKGVKLGAARPECRNLDRDARGKGARVSAEKRSRRAHGHAADLAPKIRELRAAGKTSLRELAEGLSNWGPNDAGLPTTRGGGNTNWTATAVKRVLDRIEKLEGE